MGMAANSGRNRSHGRRTAAALLALPACLLTATWAYAQDSNAPAQAPAPPTPAADPLNRTTPQSSVLGLLEACHAHDYARAMRYLDFRQIPPDQRGKEATQLARQLGDILDNSALDITTLSADPLGDVADGLPFTRERLFSCNINGQNQSIELERVTFKSGRRVWLVAADKLWLIPQIHQVAAETPFERKLPQPLVTIEIFETALWRWIALLAMGAAFWYAAGLLMFLAAHLSRAVFDVRPFRRSVRTFLTAVAFRASMSLAAPSALPRLYLQRAVELACFLSLAWVVGALIDWGTERWRSRLDQRAQSMSYSVLPLGRQVLKLTVLMIAILSVLGEWGYNTSTILAGLGVGGLAVALAAQKTIENLFGGISVIGDRPVLVGDVCRVGSHSGTVMHIGLRSTRIRTADRTVVSIPNSQFSSMDLENFSARDRTWFHQTLSLRRDSTAQKMLQVLASLTDILHTHPKVDGGKIPVRFINVGTYSFDVEISAYVLTADADEFLAIQQELLLKILQTLESSGVKLAVPLVENVDAAKAAKPNAGPDGPGVSGSTKSA